MKVKSEKLEDDREGNYAIARRRVEITDDNETVWKGIITDIGAFNYGEYKDGTVEPEGKYKGFASPEQLAESFGLEMDDLIFEK